MSGTSLEWEPGTLSTTDLRRILRDAAADLWSDSFRRDEMTLTNRERRFTEVIQIELQAATGKNIQVKGSL